MHVGGVALDVVNDVVLNRFVGFFPELIGSQTNIIKNTVKKYFRAMKGKGKLNVGREIASDLTLLGIYGSVFGLGAMYPLSFLGSMLDVMNEVFNGGDEETKVKALTELSLWSVEIPGVPKELAQLDIAKFNSSPTAYLSMHMSNYNEALNLILDLSGILTGDREVKGGMAIQGIKKLLKEVGNVVSFGSSDPSDRTAAEKFDSLMNSLGNIFLGTGRMGNLKETALLLRENAAVSSGKSSLTLGQIMSGTTPSSKITYLDPETQRALEENIVYKSRMLLAKFLGINTKFESERSKEFIKENYKSQFMGETAQFLEEL